MVEKLVQIGNLFAFYGKLLTKRQYLVVEMFYIHDLNLTEIGEELSITRQGVFDTLKRAEQNLHKYEKVLGLVEKFDITHDNVKRILLLSEQVGKIAINNNDEEITRKIELINTIGKEIIENS